MTYFYANRLDKNGDGLLTSYGNQKSADKYGGADSTITETLYFGEFYDNNAKLRIHSQARGPVVRSFMKNNGDVTSGGGQFVLYGRRDGVWSETPFSFTSYGAGNTAMKALVKMYEALVLFDIGSEAAAKTAKPSSVLDLEAL